MIKKVVIMVLILCVLFGAFVFNVYAVAPVIPPYRYKTELDDGDKVFVLLWSNRPSEIFEKSGLYYNTEPYEAIYTIDNFIDIGNEIFLSSDGMYFAVVYRRIGYNYETQVLENPAIEFYAYGKTQRSYELSEIPINYQRLMVSIHASQRRCWCEIPDGCNKRTALWWDYSDKRTFCEENNILSFFTIPVRYYRTVPIITERKVLEFDITTGEIIAGAKSTTVDALKALQYSNGLISLSPIDLIRYDMNDDGIVDVDDALLILKIATGFN